VLTDNFQRQFSYLRLSITELCNFRCLYCLPEGCAKPEQQPLSVDEIRNLVRGFAEMGVSKVRLTGGEPTLRKDLISIIQAVASVPGIEAVALTTNGHKILPLLPFLKAAGLTAINFSVDSLQPNQFEAITGKSSAADVLKAVESALVQNFESVKINVVLLKGLNSEELPAYLELVRNKRLSIRFIELMQTSDNREFFAERHLPADLVGKQILAQGWQQVTPGTRLNMGPATVFSHPEFVGTVGLITPYSQNFCASCNRLRVSARGALRLCLFGEGEYSLRPFLQSAQQLPELQLAVTNLLGAKQQSHRLLEGHYGSTQNLASIGG